MSNSEKLEAEILTPAHQTENDTDTSESNAGNETKLKTPQENAPLEKASDETVEEIIEEIAKEIPQVENCDADESENDSVEKAKEKTTKTEIETSENEVHKISVKKIGMLLTAGAVCVFSVGAIGLFGLAERSVEPEDANNSTLITSDVVVNESDNAQTQEKAATMSWWKAGVEQYNFISSDDGIMVTTTTTTTAPETTTTPKATTTAKEKTAKKTTTTKKKTTTTKKKTEYDVEEIKNTTYYVSSSVNFRKGAGTNHSIIKNLKKGTEVTAIAKTSNGWLKIKLDGATGFVSEKYLTTKKPATTTTKPAETEESKDKGTSNDTAVISYTDKELQMLYCVVEGEVGGCSDASKIAVTNVIINRVKSKKFANSLTGVLTAKNQFTAIKNYYNTYRTPTKSTKDCVKRALYGENNSKGALYFYSKKYCSSSTASWFESMTLCLDIDGQRYFK